jgi:hypothetical protein
MSAAVVSTRVTTLTLDACRGGKLQCTEFMQMHVSVPGSFTVRVFGILIAALLFVYSISLNCASVPAHLRCWKFGNF